MQFFDKRPVTHKIKIPRSKEDVLKVLWDINHIAEYEPKVNKVKVEPEDDMKGHYYPKGRFFGLPWKGKFDYHKNPNGFVSKMVVNPQGLEGKLTVNGGFSVRSLGKYESEVLHHEQYEFKGKYRVLNPFVASYIKWSMFSEMRVLKDIVLRETP